MFSKISKWIVKQIQPEFIIILFYYQKYSLILLTSMLHFAKDLFFCNGLALVFKAYKRKFIEVQELLDSKNKKTKQQIHLDYKKSFTFLSELEEVQGSKIRFIKLILVQFFKKWILVAFLSLILISLIAAQPYFSEKILSLIKQGVKNKWDFTKSIGLLFISKVIRSLVSVHLYYKQYQIGTDIYINLCIAIHQQSGKLQSAGIFSIDQRGKVLTFLQQDCNKLITLPYFLTQLIILFVQIVYGISYLTIQLPQCSFNLSYFVLSTYMVICTSLGFLATSLAQDMLFRKDNRLALSIQAINQSFFNNDKIQNARQKELSSLLTIFKLETVMRTLSPFYSAFFISTTLLWNYQNLSSKDIYLVIIFYNQISYPISQIPFVIQNFNQLLANLGRVLKFLTKRDQGLSSRQPNILYSRKKNDKLSQLKQFKKIGDISWQAIKFYLSNGGYKLFLLCILMRVVYQACTVVSSFINKSIASNGHHRTIQFFNSFLPVIPFFLSLSFIFVFSIRVSKKIYSSIKIRSQSKCTSVIMNLISNDLRIIDRMICVNIFDSLSGVLSIVRSIGLSLYSIGIYKTSYALILLPIVLLFLGVMLIINRCFMWVRREYSRIEAISRSPFISHFYNTIQISKFQIFQKKGQEYSKTFIELYGLLSKTVQISQQGIYLQSWYELILLFFSLTFITIIISIASSIIQNPSMIGLILSQILLLDNNFQNFFISLVTFERNSISLQRFHNFIFSKESDQQDSINVVLTTETQIQN